MPLRPDLCNLREKLVRGRRRLSPCPKNNAPDRFVCLQSGFDWAYRTDKRATAASVDFTRLCCIFRWQAAGASSHTMTTVLPSPYVELP